MQASPLSLFSLPEVPALSHKIACAGAIVVLVGERLIPGASSSTIFLEFSGSSVLFDSQELSGAKLRTQRAKLPGARVAEDDKPKQKKQSIKALNMCGGGNVSRKLSWGKCRLFCFIFPPERQAGRGAGGAYLPTEEAQNKASCPLMGLRGGGGGKRRGGTRSGQVLSVDSE